MDLPRMAKKNTGCQRTNMEAETQILTRKIGIKDELGGGKSLPSKIEASRKKEKRD